MEGQSVRRVDVAEVSSWARKCLRDVVTVGETPNGVMKEIEQVKLSLTSLHCS